MKDEQTELTHGTPPPSQLRQATRTCNPATAKVPPKLASLQPATRTWSQKTDNGMAPDDILWDQLSRPDADSQSAAIVQQAIRDGANVNAVRDNWSLLMQACGQGYDRIVGILLDAGADARWRTCDGWSAISSACYWGNLSAVQLLINHDNGILEMTRPIEYTYLFHAIVQHHSDIVRFLLDSGADPHLVDEYGVTTLMIACQFDNLEIVRLLLAAGVDVEARNDIQQTALHYAASLGDIEVVRELIRQHKANMFAADSSGHTPFDFACNSWSGAAVNLLLDIYGNKLTQNHGRLALHELMKVAKYSFAEDEGFHHFEDHGFHPPLNPLRIILPLGKLKLEHWHTLLHALDTDLIRNRDNCGKRPIHIACRTSAPVEVLAMLVEMDPATLHMADHAGSLPVHLCCGSGVVEYSSVQYLLAQGGVGTLSARDHQGTLPLHNLCGSTNPPLRAVQYLIQSFPGSVAMRTNAGEYPFMIAAADSSSASLSVVYELVRANPGLVVPG